MRASGTEPFDESPGDGRHDIDAERERGNEEPDWVALVARILETDPDFGTVVWLAAATGARRGELCGLQWGDINLEVGSLLIQRAVAQVGGKAATIKATKTNRARRVALGTRTVELLAAHRAHVAELFDAAGRELTESSWVFVGPDLGHLHPDTITQRFRRHADRANIKARLHDLRHWHVTQLLAAGIPVRQVSERVGHSQGAMTLGVYGHAVPAGDRRAADRIDEILEP